MGTIYSVEPTRTATFTLEDAQSIGVSDEVIDRLHDQQLKPKEAEHRDVGACSCGRHMPLQSRPTAELVDVQRTLRPLEIEHMRQQNEWQRRQTVIRPSAACMEKRDLLMRCYRANLGESLRCAQLAEDFATCLRQHCDHARQSAV